MAMKSRLVYAAAVLAALGSVPAPAQEAPLPDRPADLRLPYPAAVTHRRPSGDGPLLIVNGVPRPNSARLLDFDPEELESVDILKPPASVEHYGEAASHGAILIRLRPPTPRAPGEVRTGAWSWHAHFETCLPVLGLQPGTVAGEVCLPLVSPERLPIRIRGSRLAATP